MVMPDRYSEETTYQRLYRAFEELLRGKDEEIDLTQTALLISRIGYPDLDIASVLPSLDALARRVRSVLALPAPDVAAELPAEMPRLHVIDALNQVLFDEEHFEGDADDYYNPDNSFLHKVLERRKGIPITLSLLYIEVARRVGLQIEGIGLPYHFMVRCRLEDNIVYIDPFAHGAVMNEQGCQEYIRKLTQRRIRLHSHWFEPVTKRQFLTRMLHNLKSIYLKSDQYALALNVCTLLILLYPKGGLEYRDRGLLYLQLKRYSPAIKDLRRYLELEEQAEDQKDMLEYIKTARQMLAMMN